MKASRTLVCIAAIVVGFCIPGSAVIAQPRREGERVEHERTVRTERRRVDVERRRDGEPVEREHAERADERRNEERRETNEHRRGGAIVRRIYGVGRLVGHPDEKIRAQRTERLIDLLRPLCQGAGRGAGRIQAFAGAIIVEQPPAAQERIERFLDELRGATGEAPPRARRDVEHAVQRMKMVEILREMTSEPTIMGLVAVGGLKDNVEREPEAIIEILEDALERTKTLSFRNAIRLALRDLYQHTGRADRLVHNLRQMLAENDKAVATEKSRDEHDEHAGGDGDDD